MNCSFLWLLENQTPMIGQENMRTPRCLTGLSRDTVCSAASCSDYHIVWQLRFSILYSIQHHLFTGWFMCFPQLWQTGRAVFSPNFRISDFVTCYSCNYLPWLLSRQRAHETQHRNQIKNESSAVQRGLFWQCTPVAIWLKWDEHYLINRPTVANTIRVKVFGLLLHSHHLSLLRLLP